MAITTKMNYCSYEGFTYSSTNKLNDNKLNCIEVLRTNKLHASLNIADNSEIIIYEQDEYSKIVGLFRISRNSECGYFENLIYLSSAVISQSLPFARYIYIHELTHKILHQNGFKCADHKCADHGGHFLTALCALLICAFGEDGWKMARLYDYHDSIKDYDSIREVDDNPIERFDLFTIKMLATRLASTSYFRLSRYLRHIRERKKPKISARKTFNNHAQVSPIFLT